MCSVTSYPAFYAGHVVLCLINSSLLGGTNVVVVGLFCRGIGAGFSCGDESRAGARPGLGIRCAG